MKKLFTIVSMTLIIPALTSCGGGPKGDMPWIVDRFDDIKVIRYEVPGFDALPLEEKELIYYLSEAAKCGRDILFDQNCPVNLPVRRTLETVYENYKGDRTTAEWKALEKYLKKVWFANGIHHHYSNDKFVPEFTEGYLLDAIETIPEEKFGSLNSLRGEVCRAIFDPALYPTKLNQKAGDDLLLTSSSNYYHNVSQAEAEAFYADMAAAEDIRIACPRERFDIIARLPLFRDRIRTKHRTQFAQRDTIRETQAVRLIIGSHRTDTAFIHTVDKPAVLIAVQQVQNAAQKRGIRFGLRVKILEEDRHIAAADHADVRDLVGSQAVTVDEGLLRFQNLHRQHPGFQLDRAAADGALRMAIGEDSHFCARTARRGTG